MTEKSDDVPESQPSPVVPADQEWFGPDRWKQREQAVDEHIAAGRVDVHESTQDFLDHLDSLGTVNE